MTSHYDPNQPGQYTPPFPEGGRSPRPPKKRMPRWAKIVAVACTIPIVIVGGCTAVVIGSGVASTVASQADKTPVISDQPTINEPTEPTSAPTTDEPTEAPAPPKPVEKAPTYLPEDGTLIVGKDVKAGTYQTRIPADALGCYWARLRSLDGDLDNIIDNGLLSKAGALVTVKVRASDVALEVTCGGATWKRVGK